MYVTIKTSLAMIKRNKVQGILIGTIIMLTTTLLYIGISMLNQSNPSKVMFDRAKATENILILNKETDDIDSSKRWWNARNEVEGTVIYESYMINCEYMMGDEVESEIVLLTEYIEDSEFDLLYNTDKEISNAPTGNDILINYNFSKNRSLDIGDNITFNYNESSYDFVIAGFVVDPHFSNSFTSPSRCFVRPGFFEENAISNTNVIIGIKYKDIENTNDYALHEQYTEEIGNQDFFVDYNTIKSSYNIITSVIASVLLAVSVFIFAIVVFVIRSVIKNLILQQYKQIGVKKVLGYTNNQIRKSFLFMYGILGIGASIVGVLIGIPIRNNINAGISYDIQVSLKSGFDLFTLITIIVVVFLVVFFTSKATKQAGRIKPAQAVKYGMPESIANMGKFDVTKSSKTPLSILLAIKQLLVSSRKTITTILTIAILIYVAFIINSVGYTLSDKEHFINHLFGFQVGDISVVNNSNKNVSEFIDILESIDNVERAVFFKIEVGESTKGIQEVGKVSIGSITIYGDYPDEGMNILEGRQPKNNMEAVISSNIAAKTGKSTGDYIIISTAQGDTRFFITGIYNTINMNGNTYMSIRKNIPKTVSQNSGIYWVYYKEKHAIIEKMEETINNLVDEQVSVSRYDTNIKSVLSTLEPFPIMVKSLLSVFLAICGVIIMNFTIMDINNSIRVFGIMKATGYSNRSITYVMIIKSVILTTIGVVLGFILNLITANAVMQGVFSITPFSTIKLPVLFDVFGSLVMMGLFILISIIATIIPAKKISIISPKQLITE